MRAMAKNCIWKSVVVVFFAAIATAWSAEKQEHRDASAKSYLKISEGGLCSSDGRHQFLRNSHPTQIIEVTVIVVSAPGGRQSDVVVQVGPEKLVPIGCSVIPGTSGRPEQRLKFAVGSARFL